MKIWVATILGVLLGIGLAFGETTFTKVDEHTMKISETQEVKVKYSDLLNRKAALEKALVDINAMLAEAAKLGVTKTESIIDG
jgi:hypothetical protein